jgi:hypothetical protein
MAFCSDVTKTNFCPMCGKEWYHSGKMYAGKIFIELTVSMAFFVADFPVPVALAITFLLFPAVLLSALNRVN